MPEAMLAPGMDSESPIPVGMGDSASQKLELEETDKCNPPKSPLGCWEGCLVSYCL